MDIVDGDFIWCGKVIDDVLGNVVDLINLMVGEFVDMLWEVQGVLQLVNQGLVQMFMIIVQIGQGLQFIVEQLCCFVEWVVEISLWIQDFVCSVQDSVVVVQQVFQILQQGQQVVQGILQGMVVICEGIQDVVQMMQVLSECFEQIQGIVDIIIQILSQINLFLLYVFIEVVGVGEVGSCFVVVVDEVCQFVEQINEVIGCVVVLIIML